MTSGTVVRGGVPVSGAYVRLIGPSGEYVSERRTLDDGAFRFHIPPGSWRVVVFGPGIERQELELASDEEELTIEVGGD
ncbi:MAG: DUF1416 domain-containing protein [Actinomycetota bacterium]